MQLKFSNLFLIVVATVMNVILVGGCSFVILWTCEQLSVSSGVAGVFVAEVGVFQLAVAGMLLWHNLSKTRSLAQLNVLILAHLLLGLPVILLLYDLAACINAPF
jgi:hypothetical protein